MPNWALCHIEITGNMEKISKMLSKDEDGDVFLKNLVPYEGEWDYEWCCDNWGTKWDVGENSLEVNDDGLCGWADFAWSPPMTCFEKYCNQNDDVFIKMCFIEPHMSFLGYWDSNGNIIYENDYNYRNHNTIVKIIKRLVKLMLKKTLILSILKSG